MQFRYFLGQAVSFFLTLARLIPLRIHNDLDGSKIPSTGPVTVSLTSHGARLNQVWFTIESIARGTVKAPIVLWLDEADYNQPLHPRLQKLVDRGLQVRCSDGDFGPHTKYWPIFRQQVRQIGELVQRDHPEYAPDTATADWYPTEVPPEAMHNPEYLKLRVVTADDDMIYPEWWLQRLLLAAEWRPDCVVAYRAHRVELNEKGIMPYSKWTPVNTCAASYLHFATGVSGVLYPLPFMCTVVKAGEDFQKQSPRADDIWLHACALRSKTKIRQVFSHQRNFAVVPTTQLSPGLLLRNVLRGGNDAQARAVYTREDIEELTLAAARED